MEYIPACTLRFVWEASAASTASHENRIDSKLQCRLKHQEQAGGCSSGINHRGERRPCDVNFILAEAIHAVLLPDIHPLDVHVFISEEYRWISMNVVDRR